MITAILLAAGLSSRTKQFNKLLINYKRKKIIQHSVSNILSSKIDYLLVITGRNHNKIRRYIPNKKNIKIIFNRNYKLGMSTSIKKGIKYLPKNTSYFFVTLADMPNIKKNHYNKMILLIKKNTNIPIVPFFKSQQCNPVLFPILFASKLKKLKGDVGAKKILTKTKIKKIQFSNNSFLKDFDTLKDFSNHN